MLHISEREGILTHGIAYISDFNAFIQTVTFIFFVVLMHPCSRSVTCAIPAPPRSPIDHRKARGGQLRITAKTHTQGRKIVDKTRMDPCQNHIGPTVNIKAVTWLEQMQYRFLLGKS